LEHEKEASEEEEKIAAERNCSSSGGAATLSRIGQIPFSFPGSMFPVGGALSALGDSFRFPPSATAAAAVAAAAAAAGAGAATSLSTADQAALLKAISAANASAASGAAATAASGTHATVVPAFASNPFLHMWMPTAAQAAQAVAAGGAAAAAAAASASSSALSLPLLSSSTPLLPGLSGVTPAAADADGLELRRKFLSNWEKLLSAQMHHPFVPHSGQHKQPQAARAQSSPLTQHTHSPTPQ